jgi:4-carboxymuconolactone decarboxylase
MKVRREVLGDAYVDEAEAGRTPLTEEFQDLITRYAWGEIWTRPGLDRRTRSCITVAMLVALNRNEELALHMRGAMRNGVTADELKEILLQTAIYCGVPASLDSFRIAREVFAEAAAK